MSKYLAPLALTLTLTLAAAHADAVKPTGDLYNEAVWDIHAAAQPAPGNAGAATAGDIHDEAVWDIHAGFDDPALANRFAKTQSAGMSAHPAGRSAGRLDQAE